jgi:hypothetical protein
VSCGLGFRSLGWLANAVGTAECGSSTVRGNAVCGRTACTVWEGAGGNAPMMPSPVWIAGWHIGGAPLAYLITHGALDLVWDRAGCAYEAGRSGRAGSAWRSPMSIKGPSRRRDGCAGKAVGLIRGDLHGSPRCPSASFGAFVGWCGTARVVRRWLAVEKSAEAVLPAGIVDGGWEGPNAKPSAKTFVLVIVALTAANPSGGLSGSDRG